MENKMRNKRGFSLVELLIVIVIIGVLSVVAYIAIEKTRTKAMNDKMQSDLVAIANALEDYRRDHDMKYPVPEPSPETNQNILCYYADATYAHDCADAVFRQGMIDNNLLTRRYLREVPTDPHTGTRYAYGVTNDGKFFEVAGIYKLEDGTYQARTVDNLAKGFELSSVIRAFDSQNFVIDRDKYLPYSADYLVMTGTIRNIVGSVSVQPPSGSPIEVGDGAIVTKGDTVTTDITGSADIFFSDGSVTHLNPGASVTLEKMEVAKNDKDGTFTSVILNLNVGKIWSKVVRLASNSSFDVKTTGAIAGVRGTEYGVEADSSGNLKEVVVLSGDVEVTNPTYPTMKIEEFTDVQPAEPKKAVFTAGGASSGQTTADPSEINGNYYKNIPLSTVIRPHILSAKYENGQTKIIIRNVNYFANIVNAQLGLTGDQARKVQANYLVAYSLGSNGSLSLMRKIILPDPTQVNDTTQPYTIIGDKKADGTDEFLGNSVVFRFENIIPPNIIDKSSAFSIPPVTVTEGTDLTESALYPNMQNTDFADSSLVINAPSFFAISKNTSGNFVPADITPDILVTIENAPAEFTPTVTVSSDSASVCSAETANITSLPPQFNVKIHAIGTGDCSITTAITFGNNKTVSSDFLIKIVPATDKLILLTPQDGISVPEGNVNFSWAAPGGGASFKLVVDGTQVTSANPTAKSATAQITSTGTHNWSVTSLNSDNTQIATKSAQFTTFVRPDVNFEIKKPDYNVLLNWDESQLTLSAPTDGHDINIRLYASGAPSTATYEWTFNKIIPSDPLNMRQDFLATINTQDLPVGSTMYASATLTIRAESGNVIGTKTKGITVINGLPQFTNIAFAQTSLTTERNISIIIPDILITEPAGLSVTPVTLDKCSPLAVNHGIINGNLYYSPTDTGITSDTITCTIPKNTNIQGHVAANDISTTLGIAIGGGVTCGNGQYDPGEICDDSNTSGDDGCSADCHQIESGYTCTGFPTSKSVCTLQTVAVCGLNGKEEGEECDGADFGTTNIPTCSTETGGEKPYGSLTCGSPTAGVNACKIDTSGCKSLQDMCNTYSGSKYFDNNVCWILGGATDNCNTACANVKDPITNVTLHCTDAVNNGEWSINNNICAGLIGAGKTITGSVTTSNGPYILGTSLCKSISSKSICATSPESSSKPRICKCQ